MSPRTGGGPSRIRTPATAAPSADASVGSRERAHLGHLLGQRRHPQHQVLQRAEVDRLRTAVSGQQRSAPRLPHQVRGVEVGQRDAAVRPVLEQLGGHPGQPERHQRAERRVVLHPDRAGHALGGHPLDVHAVPGQLGQLVVGGPHGGRLGQVQPHPEEVLAGATTEVARPCPQPGSPARRRLGLPPSRSRPTGTAPPRCRSSPAVPWPARRRGSARRRPSNRPPDPWPRPGGCGPGRRTRRRAAPATAHSAPPERARAPPAPGWGRRAPSPGPVTRPDR